MTQEHFAEEYGKKVRFFIYNSSQLTEIDRFASDNSINVMIINSQAFNARGKDARRIYMKLDEFRSRRPIDIIAKTNPIMIIDEPQSVEGKQTKENLKQFNPLMTLRYSATHKSDSIYNMIYRLDAMEAYNKRLVKKIAVKGITESGSTATESYIYLESMPEFKALWNKINSKSVYVVDFDTDELVKKAIVSLDKKLRVSKIYFRVETGAMEQIKSKEALVSGTSFVKEEAANYGNVVAASSNVKYDLIGKLVDETGLTRKAVIQILQGIQPATFNQFKDNPEEFIIKAAALINDEKATSIIEHITYDVMDEKYDTDVFTDPTIKGRLGVNAMKAKKHLYDHIVYDSSNEQKFATELDINTNVAVYVKLPDILS